LTEEMKTRGIGDGEESVIPPQFHKSLKELQEEREGKNNNTKVGGSEKIKKRLPNVGILSRKAKRIVTKTHKTRPNKPHPKEEPVRGTPHKRVTAAN